PIPRALRPKRADSPAVSERRPGSFPNPLVETLAITAIALRFPALPKADPIALAHEQHVPGGPSAATRPWTAKDLILCAKGWFVRTPAAAEDRTRNART